MDGHTVNIIPDDEQFADNILKRWDCELCANENSNELDVLLATFWKNA